MDPSNPGAMLKAVLPKIPFVLKTVALHTLNLTNTASKWDLRTEVTVRVIRSFIDGSGGTRQSVSEAQKMSLKDGGVKGKKWISRYTIPKPQEDDMKQQLLKAIEDMKEGGEEYTIPEMKPVEVEWTGYRKDAKHDAPEPDMSEAEKYTHLSGETTSDVVIMYLHGGAYYLMDPASHRSTVVKLCELTGGRAMSVRYRLAPQNPFPAALLDAFVSYLSLLYPPAGAPHPPTDPSKVIISGDSAGANLSASLLQLILQLHHTSQGKTPQVLFNGSLVDVPIPAGLALNSPWCDMTSCLDSISRNAKYDYLPSEWNPEGKPDCDIWPTDPPRIDYYAGGSMLRHPLVSPLGAVDWTGAPPVFVVIGEELLADEGSVLACRLVKQGGKVVYEQYEAQPHCFGMIFEGQAVGHSCFDAWSKFCIDAVKGSVVTKGSFLSAKKLERKDVDVKGLMDGLGLSEDIIREKMKKRQAELLTEFEARQARRAKKNVPPAANVLANAKI
jgi:acetyl esterase/lipase